MARDLLISVVLLYLLLRLKGNCSLSERGVAIAIVKAAAKGAKDTAKKCERSLDKRGTTLSVKATIKATNGWQWRV